MRRLGGKINVIVMDSDEDILDLDGLQGLDEFEDVFDGLSIDPKNTRTVRFETIIEENLLDELPPDSLRRELHPPPSLSASTLFNPTLSSSALPNQTTETSAESIATDIQSWKQKQGSFRLMLETRKREKRESEERAKIVQQDSAISIFEDMESGLPLDDSIQHSSRAVETLMPMQTTPRNMQSRLRPPTPSLKSRTPSVTFASDTTLHSRDHSALATKTESPLRTIGRKYAGGDVRETMKYRRTACEDEGQAYSKIAVRSGLAVTPVKTSVGSLKRLNEMRLEYARN